jgi:hypothetical protein
MRAHDLSRFAVTPVRTAEDSNGNATPSPSELLESATHHTRRLLREIGQWTDDISHEKMAVRWGYEFVQRFLAKDRTEKPCRPFLLLESMIAKRFSEGELCWSQDTRLSSLTRFVDGLASRAVVSRDALMALFYHLYGFSASQVVRLLGLGPAESQRVYKNFERWRRTGWQRTMIDLKFCDEDIRRLEQKQRRQPARLSAEAKQLSRGCLDHYRKSEPEHFHCLSHEQWLKLFEDGYGYDYRTWHLALCPSCFADVCPMRFSGEPTVPDIDLQVRPMKKGKMSAFVLHRSDRIPDSVPFNNARQISVGHQTANTNLVPV